VCVKKVEKGLRGKRDARRYPPFGLKEGRVVDRMRKGRHRMGKQTSWRDRPKVQTADRGVAAAVGNWSASVQEGRRDLEGAPWAEGGYSAEWTRRKVDWGGWCRRGSLGKDGRVARQESQPEMSSQGSLKTKSAGRAKGEGIKTVFGNRAEGGKGQHPSALGGAKPAGRKARTTVGQHLTVARPGERGVLSDRC